MTESELFECLRDNLKVRVSDASEGPRFGGEIGGRPGVRVELLLVDPLGRTHVISESRCTLDKGE